jgi:hypothetical protein
MPARTPTPHLTQHNTTNQRAGEIWADKTALEERWGAANQSYYSIPVSYFSNPSAAALMGIISRDFLWVRTLSSSATFEADARDLLAGRLLKAAKSVDQGRSTLGISVVGKSLGVGNLGAASSASAAAPSAASTAAAAAAEGKVPEALAVGAHGATADAVSAATALASELLRAQASHSSKRAVFCNCKGGAAHLLAALTAARGKGEAAGGGGGGGGGGSGSGSGGGGASAAQIPYSALASALEVAATKVSRG